MINVERQRQSLQTILEMWEEILTKLRREESEAERFELSMPAGAPPRSARLAHIKADIWTYQTCVDRVKLDLGQLGK
jgi:hypothetical protein